MYNKGFTISRSGCLVNIDFEFVHLQQKIFPKSGFCIYLGKHCQLAPGVGASLKLKIFDSSNGENR